ncbi:MAG TPA: hypothetical protein DF613_00915 [Lachnospiraceae bacterium]|nr:hypothetical protein [Lachnospiraceae bacterium]
MQKDRNTAMLSFLPEKTGGAEMDTKGIAIMKKRSGFEARKLAVTVAVSVSLAAIIQAHWFSEGAGGRIYRWRQAVADRESMAVFSGTREEKEAGSSAQVQSRKAAVSEDEANEIYRENSEQLVLVNRENPLSPAYDAMLQQICGGRLEASSRLYGDLQAMFADAADVGHTFWIASAYRSREKQQELIDEEADALMAEGMSREEALDEIYRETMPVGCSEHETGLALDILVSGNMEMDQSQEESVGNRWLRENCQDYGFVLRYPEDKSSVTGVDYEPWHFRYVGKRAARFLKNHGLTLEEFYQLLEV